MRTSGFSLLELLLVIAVTGILLSIATLEFNKMIRKGGIEAQTRTLYNDLMTVRSDAMYQRRGRAVSVTASSYKLYSSTVVAGSATVTKELKYPIVSNASTDLVFDEQGLLTNPGSGGRSICTSTSAGTDVTIDSIVISTTRVQLGKWDTPGGTASDCIASKITNK